MMSHVVGRRKELLIKVYQKVQDFLRSKTCCDDDIMWAEEKSSTCQSNIFLHQMKNYKSRALNLYLEPLFNITSVVDVQRTGVIMKSGIVYEIA